VNIELAKVHIHQEVYMATIYKEFIVNASPGFVWEAIKDVGAVHSRLAQGFVTNTLLSGDTRKVTFENGFVVREKIVTISDELQRLSYTSIGGRASHHNAYIQVFGTQEGKARVLWVTDLLPEEIREPIAEMVEKGSAAIKETLERLFQDK
jgi:Polyketide cyclase / dehydrase and lipid transport